MPITQTPHGKESKVAKNFFDRVPRREVLAVKRSCLKKAFNAIAKDWNAHLKNAGIKLPAENTAKGYQLTVLKHFQGRAVHKEDISAFVAKHTGQPASDQQVRHLKTQGGWHILNRGDVHLVNGREIYNPDGCHVLITTAIPLPNALLTRRAVVESGDWDEILKQYGYQCASCGTKLGERHRYDSSYKVDVFERGHMDPHKPLEAGNIIPQCRWCNRAARADFVFDRQGRPRAVAGIRPVSRASREVVAKIKKWIRNK